jgi:hypothetical protein
MKLKKRQGPTRAVEPFMKKKKKKKKKDAILQWRNAYTKFGKDL